MNKSELPFLTASDLSKLMAAKEVSPVEATEAYLDRIEALDAKYRAYVTVAADVALAAAKRAEQEIAQGNHRGPMHGVPVAAKDQINTQGILTTGGSPVFKDNIPTFDATVIANLKAAGAVLLGKLNMTEFATSGLSHQFDPPRNPWGLDRSTGGSSHGSISMCYSPGRRHRWLGAIPGVLVRPGWYPPDLGPGQPLRGDAGRPFHGHHRPPGKDGGRLRHNPGGHCGSRPQ